MSPPPVCPCDPPAANGSHGPPIPPPPAVPASSLRVPSGRGCPAVPLLPELPKASLAVAFSLLLWLPAVPEGGSPGLARRG